MKHFNINTLFICLTFITLAALTQSCSTDVGGNEDTTKPSVELINLNDGNDIVIEDFDIKWSTTEVNRSKVDILLSYDSGVTYLESDAIALNKPDAGVYTWKSNDAILFKDCRTCKIKIQLTDIALNKSKAVESENDFVINNVPQVLGLAFYTDVNNDGPGEGDILRIPFDKDIELLTAIASNVFIFPVLGDSIGPFATVSKNNGRPNELNITFNNILSSNFHLHVSGTFNTNKLNRTLPSGLNILNNLADGVLITKITERTATPTVNGIDIAPTFGLNNQSLSNNFTASVTLGDVDNDGDLDLVSGNEREADLVWFNDGSGNFTDSGQRLGNSDTQSITLGDVDGDGDPDLVSGNSSGANLVWFNDGNGNFTDSGQRLGSSDTQSITLEDVDEDGDYDIISGNLSGANLVWFNDGSGNFTDSGQRLGSSDTQSITLGDVDEDGDYDIISGNSSGANLVWFNDGSGNFTDSGQRLGGGDTASISLCDVDEDGDNDLISGNIGGTNVVGEPNLVWLNDGSGYFTDSGQRLGNYHTQSITLGDVDGDGDPDLVSGNHPDFTIGGGSGGANLLWLSSLKFPGDKFIDRQQLLGNSFTTSITLGDVDGDDDPDLVTGNLSSGNLIWFNDGSGAFTDSGQRLGSSDTLSITLGDVDDDRDLDFIAGNNNTNLVWLNDGSGNFTDSGQRLGTSSTRSIALGDIDGDLDLDFIAGNNNTNLVWLNDGSGNFTDSGQRLGFAQSRAITLGDVDDDGDLDFIAGNARENLVWFNDGSGNFTDSGQRLGFNDTQSIALGDIDGDLDLDFIAGNNNTNLVWLNDGSGNFTDSGQRLSGVTVTHSITLSDVDDDGDRDIITGGAHDNDTGAAHLIWLNDGSGNFTDSGQRLGFAQNRAITLGDVDDDGDPDFVTGNINANQVWLNDY